MKCSNNSCNNDANDIQSITDFDGNLISGPVCKQCQGIEYKPGKKCFEVIPQ